VAEGLIEGEFKALSKRGITEETCRKFGYQVGSFKGKTVQIAPYFNADREMVAQKVRTPDKEFFITGTIKGAGLFGQHLWGSGGKMVVVTEGEIDALTVSQLQGNRWPVVSIPNGAQGAVKAIAEHLSWLNSYEKVVLMFDMDEPGREAASAVAKTLKPGKAHIASLPLKDANECLVKGQGEAVIQAIWNAKPYRPDGVVRVRDIKERVLTPPTMGISWFFESLTKLTYGRRFGELYAFGAGTGIGKTDLLTQQIEHDINVLGEKCGLFLFEQDVAETVKRIAGKFCGKCFHIPDDGWTQEELEAAVDRIENDDRLLLYDSYGMMDWETVAETIRYLFHAEGIRVYYIDHLTALAAGEDDEKKTLENIMAEMAGLAKELGIIIHLVSHLATPEGKPHEEGGRVTIRHFKGSRAIGFWCNFMFGLERDQQHENPEWRSITTFRVLKDRNTGRAGGEVVYLGYDRETGRLFETTPPVENTGFKDQTLENPDF
jgi:twinkle protein